MVIDNLEKVNTENKNLPIVTSINGEDLKILFKAALAWLRTNEILVNLLNVYPIPDGDTGTNMLHTMQSAFDDIADSDEKNIGKMAHAISQGTLMGGTGNSGVILSQLWRGFARALDNLEIMDSHTLISALRESRNTAYKGVVRPVEGTILTVANDIAISAEKAVSETDDLVQILKQIVDGADRSVQHTPELLPILKQAGVVDSGGKGLFIILEGMLRFLEGASLETATTTVQPLSSMNLKNAFEEVEPGQDYEVVIDFQPKAELDLEKHYAGLSSIGTSIQIGEGDGMYRIHIHVPTEKRNDPENYIKKFGKITKVVKENLLAQIASRKESAQLELSLESIKPGQVAVVAVSPGLGISQIFASLGVAAIVEGGQTMNPSTEQILQACENLPTESIIILPNNKNIYLAAESASTMTSKKVKVVPSKSVPQGLSAILRLVPDGDLDDLYAKMNESLGEIETGEITTSTRTVEINGVNVKKGEVIILHNGTLIGSSNNLLEACLKFLDSAKTYEKEHITFFYGESIKDQEVNNIVEEIRKKYPSHEIEVHSGGQPYYQFIISVE
jgi:DAK2 domain fusion protein YloV